MLKVREEGRVRFRGVIPDNAAGYLGIFKKKAPKAMRVLEMGFDDATAVLTSASAYYTCC